MSKIICDICGTTYPENANRCPICGCVRPGDARRVTNEVKTDGNVVTGYTYVKGGRFSKSNVKKRNKERAAGATATNKPDQQGQSNDGNESNRGLVIIALLLLLAIICVVIFIAVRFFKPISDPGTTTEGTHESSTGDSQPLNPPCESITLDIDTVILEQEGDGRLLNVTVHPVDTQDKVTFRSENEAVATVSDAGKITAVGKGTTKIIITCGDITKECKVICQFEEDTTTEPTVTQPTGPVETIRLNRSDITFRYKGESWILYNGSVAKDLITWSSDNESIVTFVDGKAVAIAPGTTKIHAEYEGQKVSCIIRCRFEDGTGVGGNGGVGEDGGDNGGSNPATTYVIYTHHGPAQYNYDMGMFDISIKVGTVSSFSLRDNAGNAMNVTWTSKGSNCTLSDNKLTAVTSGITYVSATYEGKTYTCIVRVS